MQCTTQPVGEGLLLAAKTSVPARTLFSKSGLLMRLLGFALLPLIAASARAATDDANLQYFRDIAETRNYTLGRPVSPKITPDGAAVIFLRGGPRDPVLRLYELNLSDGREREVLTPAQLLGRAEETLSVEEKARRERARQTLRGFTFFDLSDDGAKLLVSLSGKLYVIARASLTVATLPGTGWIDPRFSPNGAFVAAAGPDRELHLFDLATNTEHAITSGASATLSHGTAEFVAQEEMSRPRGFWWSPASDAILCQETDESPVETRYIADPLHPEIAPTKFFYPRAGSPNAVVRLFLVPLNSGHLLPVAWDSTAFPYLAHVAWQRNVPLALLVQNREQTEERLLAVDATSGTTRELLRETDSAWLNLDDNHSGSTGEHRPPFWSKDGKSFVWTTERRGAWQVEWHEGSGRLVRELTPPTWNYYGFIGLDEANNSFYVRGGNDPREVHVWRFPLSGGAGVALTAQPGVHGATYFPKAGMLVRTLDPWDGQFRVEIVRAADGAIVGAVRSVAEPPPHPPRTELTRVRAAADETNSAPLEFDAAITRPSHFVSGQKYPVLLSVYAGPTSKMVTASRRSFLPDQWMADQGYIVVRIDGRGTPWHGRAWERVIKGNFIDIALHDQIAGLQALAARVPEMDLARVGVTGWSFGGYFSAIATIRRPDVFRCGVAGAPVITWENYDTHYTERYLGLPQAAPAAYRVSDVTTYAAQLSRPLLLIHGLTDDNVYFQHTLQLADALYLSGKYYEFLPMLGTHLAGASEPLVRLREQQRVIEFFNRELRP